MKVCRSRHPMDTSVYCILVTHYYIVGSGRAAIRPHSEEGIRIADLAWLCPGSRMALYIVPHGCLRQGIEAEPVAPAVEPYRREFLLPKHGDDPIQRNTARAPDKSGVHESIWRDLSRRKTPIGNSADWRVLRHYYIPTMS